MAHCTSLLYNDLGSRCWEANTGSWRVVVIHATISKEKFELKMLVHNVKLIIQ